MAEIRWYGHNCIRIKAREATVFIDPVSRSTGYAMGKHNADIVVLSATENPGVSLTPIRPGYRTIAGPGEYEMHEVFVTGVRTYQDAEQGKIRGYNTVYLIEVEGLKVGHLGFLGHRLTEEQAEALEDVDILFAPAGGGDRLSAERVADQVTDLSPNVVIPVHFATPIGDRKLDDAATFSKQLGLDMPEPEDKFVVKRSDLTDALRIVMLRPEGDPAKR